MNGPAPVELLIVRRVVQFCVLVDARRYIKHKTKIYFNICRFYSNILHSIVSFRSKVAIQIRHIVGDIHIVHCQYYLDSFNARGAKALPNNGAADAERHIYSFVFCVIYHCLNKPMHALCGICAFSIDIYQ